MSGFGSLYNDSVESTSDMDTSSEASSHQHDSSMEPDRRGITAVKCLDFPSPSTLGDSSCGEE